MYIAAYLLNSFSEAVKVVLNESLALKHLFPQQTNECKKSTEQKNKARL